ncbi:MAG: GH116 family glycosyl hydrolase [Saccharofermentanales bacterium]
MKTYSGKNLDMISFPMGGTGAGMICLHGNGSLGDVSLWNKPELNNNPDMFSAVTIISEKGNISRVLEAPVPDVNYLSTLPDSANGFFGKNYGLPRFTSGEFTSRFPFATIRLKDDSLPIAAELTGWSPFIPNDEDNSSYPFAAIEYTFTNISDKPVDAVYYFNAFNFNKINDESEIRVTNDGFIFEQRGDKDSDHIKGAFCADVGETGVYAGEAGANAGETAYIDAAWFRGIWYDFSALTMLWNNISNGVCKNVVHPDPQNGQSPGASLALPFRLEPGDKRTIKLKFAWYAPVVYLKPGLPYAPWYTNMLSDIDDARMKWNDGYDFLYNETKKFADCFNDTTLPDEIIDAVSANLSILKSPTVTRMTDGRIWGWEGSGCNCGCCEGSCTHVWNYAQSLCNLFPRLERSMREIEFFESQDDETGHQQFRISSFPVRKSTHEEHSFHAAADGQLGGIIKVYRDWKISGDRYWLAKIWPAVKQSLDYCIGQWDTDREGIIKQPHHNTYDIEFWGPDGMTSSFYIGALKAAYEMGLEFGEDNLVYKELYDKGRYYLENDLFNGEYFYQKTGWEGLNVESYISGFNSETKALFEKEGPKHQYGSGCLANGLTGIWLAEISGLDDVADEKKLIANLLSIYKYNFKNDLSLYVNPQRPGYASKNDAGLLNCTWPNGGKPTLPMIYSDEVWTGFEYQVASHLISKGFVQEGLDIVNACRDRYDGTIRNPFDELECGHWYARAMSSYALLQAYTGVRYDNVTKTLYYSTKNAKSYKVFLSTATGYGTVEVNDGNIKLNVVSGVVSGTVLVV